MKTNYIKYQTEKSSIIRADSYAPPRIEVIEVSIEKGFADSSEDYEEDTW